MFKKILLSATLVLILLLGGSFLTPSDEEEVALATQRTPANYQLVDATSTIHVAGVVSSVNTAVISASTNGTVQSISVKEGSYVRAGDWLAVQDTRVADARLAYQAAAREQTEIERAAAVDNYVYTAEKASATAHSAQTIALLQNEAVASRMQEQLIQVRTEVESGVTTLLDTLTFVNNNKSLFSDGKQEQFRSIVNNLYGMIPNHFRGGIMYGNSSDTADVLDTLQEMRTIEVNNLAAVDVETLAVIVMGQTQALIDLYTSAESNVLDRETILIGSDTYNTYFANREAIIQTLSQLESAQSSLQMKIDAIGETEARTEQSVTISALDEELAARQTIFSKAIAAASEVSARASENIVAVERSLGTVVSPFSGVVAQTFKEIGEYAAAGEPLLTIIGAGGRELSVSVPVTFVSQVAVGSTFIVDGKIVGVVDRLSPVSSGHSVTVVILLSDVSAQVGTSLSGELTILSKESSFLVPREYVFFTSKGPEVRDVDGRTYPAHIDYDNGDMLRLTFSSALPAQPLTPSRSISFK